MSKIPRLLPLVGVAIGGVIAVNALSGAHALPGLLSATQAAAEEALHPKGKHAKADAAAAAPSAETASAPVGQSPAGQSALPPSGAGQSPSGLPAPVCAQSPADLAKAAGLSPAELQVLQSLQTRRGQIDDREKDLDTEVQLLAAAEAKLDGKLQSMNSLKGDIQALLGQADQKSQAEIDRLTIVYSKMKPADAAAVMAQLDDKVRLPIAASMKPAVLSAILGKMATLEAKDLTEKLAKRFAPIQALAQAANAPPAAAAPAPPAKSAPTSKAPPAKTAAAAPDPTAAAADPAADTKAAPVKKPAPKKRIAKAAPKKVAKAAAPVEKAKADVPALPSKPQPYTAAKDKSATPAAPAATPAKAG